MADNDKRFGRVVARPRPTTVRPEKAHGTEKFAERDYFRVRRPQPQAPARPTTLPGKAVRFLTSPLDIVGPVAETLLPGLPVPRGRELGAMVEDPMSAGDIWRQGPEQRALRQSGEFSEMARTPFGAATLATGGIATPITQGAGQAFRAASQVLSPRVATAAASVADPITRTVGRIPKVAFKQGKPAPQKLPKRPVKEVEADELLTFGNLDPGETIPLGKQSLLDQLGAEVRKGTVSPENGEIATAFLNKLPEKYLDDLGSSYRKQISDGPTIAGLLHRRRFVGGEKRLPSIVNIATEVTENMSRNLPDIWNHRVIVHEVAHHLEDFVGVEDADKLFRQFQREFRSQSPPVATLLQKIKEARRGTGEPTVLSRSEANTYKKVYRFFKDPDAMGGEDLMRQDFNEWFAEVITDKVLRDLYMEIPGYRNIIQKALAQIKIIAQATRRYMGDVLGRTDDAERVYKKLVSGDYSAHERLGLKGLRKIEEMRRYKQAGKLDPDWLPPHGLPPESFASLGKGVPTGIIRRN